MPIDHNLYAKFLITIAMVRQFWRYVMLTHSVSALTPAMCRKLQDFYKPVKAQTQQALARNHNQTPLDTAIIIQLAEIYICSLVLLCVTFPIA